MAAPYSLPWYDAVAWAPLALVAGGALDAVLLVRLVAYAMAYVPGRVLGLTPTVQDLTLGYRRHVTPYVGALALLAVVLLAARRRVPKRGDARGDDQRDGQGGADGRDGRAGVVEREPDHPHDQAGHQTRRAAPASGRTPAAARSRPTSSAAAARGRRTARRPAPGRTGRC